MTFIVFLVRKVPNLLQTQGLMLVEDTTYYMCLFAPTSPLDLHQILHSTQPNSHGMKTPGIWKKQPTEPRRALLAFLGFNCVSEM